MCLRISVTIDFRVLPRFRLVEPAELADLPNNPLRYLIGSPTALCELAAGGGRHAVAILGDPSREETSGSGTLARLL